MPESALAPRLLSVKQSPNGGLEQPTESKQVQREKVRCPEHLIWRLHMNTMLLKQPDFVFRSGSIMRHSVARHLALTLTDSEVPRSSAIYTDRFSSPIFVPCMVTLHFDVRCKPTHIGHCIIFVGHPEHVHIGLSCPLCTRKLQVGLIRLNIAEAGRVSFVPCASDPQASLFTIITAFPILS